jgi:hypothetical protein
LISLKPEKAVVCGAGGWIGGELVIREKVGLVWAARVQPRNERCRATNGAESLAELGIAGEIERRLGQNVRMDLGSDAGAHLR